jgi:predicted transcriptional regulator of viral defense system
MAGLSKQSSGRRRLPAPLAADHPILTLDVWARALGGGPRGRARARDAARYYARTARVRLVTRGIYAVVPPGADPDRFQPDPFLVANALRPDAVVSHHSAWTLLGKAHSPVHFATYLTKTPRRLLRFHGFEWRALPHPRRLIEKRRTDLGVIRVDRRGVLVSTTGPERTLVDGFAGLRWAGGLEEHVQSASGVDALDLDLLERYLGFLDSRLLHAAVGWFLEAHQRVAPNAEPWLRRFERRGPRQPLYLGSRRLGGVLVRRWNILVPRSLLATVSGAEA